MKRFDIRAILILIAAMGLSISSCKKLTYADLSSSQDAVNVGFHLNALMDDAANAVSKTATLSGSVAVMDSVPGGKVDTSQVATGLVTVTYDPTVVVDGRFTHSGTMTVQLTSGSKWTDQNAQLSIYFHSVKFTNVASGDSYTYDGPGLLLNTLSGLAYQMLADDPAAVSLGAIQYNFKSTGDTITFNDGVTRVWAFNRIRTFTYTAGVSQIAVSSSYPAGGYANVDMYGTDHSGNEFYESIVVPATFQIQDCPNPVKTNTPVAPVYFRDAIGGQARVYEQQFAINLGFGAVSATSGSVALTCPYGFKTTYVNSRNDYVEAESPYWN